MLTLFSAYFPIMLLIYLMTKKHGMAASTALPLCASFAYIVVFGIFKLDSNLMHASVLSGLLMALTPVTIIAGAIFLFRCMEVSGALYIVRLWLNQLSNNHIAQLMIVGWAFAFLIEGASGFGTPAAIAAPILVRLGFPAVRVVVACLILNSIPVTFGAVGTPIWFGLSMTDLSPLILNQVAWKAALINAVAAPIVVLGALAFVVSEKQQLKQNIVFILLSTFSCTLPYLLLSFITVEFPSLIGGLIGLIITLLLAKFNIGLDTKKLLTDSSKAPSLRAVFKATFPLWGTVLLLVITRIPELGIKSLLQLTTPAWQLSLGFLGDFSLSAALVFKLENILETEVLWQHNLLYVPSILPFIVIGILSLWWFKKGKILAVLLHTGTSLKKPVIALMGALVFVNLMMLGGTQSAVSLIGQNLANISGDKWLIFSPFLGALGSFFSGSATISNLTFAGIQYSIATDLGLNVSTIMALQAVGSAMGNMICIHNIVAVTSILALNNVEGYILKRSMAVLLIYGMVASSMGILLA
ncbi:L-lactate permease [uncultured Paraglaciecola sp.]|uniref:L-lactate permease n=1 Tax=uncultured Paraglaciecola sp. TaxID=1765024 RepID=UPI002592CF4D|nr:L-lactate permease [uncultured Paraglaciecola sp.]